LKKTIKSFGYVDELEKEFPDPIAHFKEVVAEMERERRKENAPVSIEVDFREELKAGSNRKNFGYVALSSLYHSLGLRELFNNCQSDLNSSFSLNSIVRLLVFDRVLAPSSKKAAFENRESYFERFDFSLDDIYRSLSVLAELKERVVLFLHKRITRDFGRDTELVYYDVTNYYFESDTTDELRKKGVCKEHRPDPIVQMGLLMDNSALPITYKLFPGNTNDCLTLLPVLSEVKRDYNLKRIIVVADKGLNTSDNVTCNILGGDGYVYSQSVRKANDELRKWIIRRKGWKTEDGEIFTRSRLGIRNVWTPDPTGKKDAIEIEEKQVAIYSKKYAERARLQRAETIAKAREYVTNPPRYKQAVSYGAAKYVKGLQVDKKTGEVLKDNTKLFFDEEKLAAEEELDGFYCIVTSEKNKSAAEIARIYHGLWKIEQTFRVTKTDLRTRPIYVSLKDHIEAHFLTCFLALILIRLLEIKTKHRYSPTRLIEAMKKCSASKLTENIWLFDYKDEVLDSIGEGLGIDFSKKQLRLADIKNILAGTKKS